MKIIDTDILLSMKIGINKFYFIGTFAPAWAILFGAYVIIKYRG